MRCNQSILKRFGQALLSFLTVCGISSPLLALSPYNAAVLADNPLVYWTFDESSGNAIEQVSGIASAEMVPMGGATRAPSATTLTGVSLGSAAVMDGVAGSRFQASDIMPGSGPGADFIASQRWAVEFWVNLGGSGQAYLSETYAATSNNPGVIYGFQPGLELFGGGGRTGTAAPVPLNVGQWHHVVAAFYGNSSGFGDNLREIYVDGVLSLTDTTSAFSAGHGLNTMAIGNAVTPNENPAPLMIDEYAVYELPGVDLLSDQLFVERLALHAYVIPEPTGVMLFGLAGLAFVQRARRSR
jgi:hypothetical protein